MDDPTDATSTPHPRCPICQRDTEPAFRPFCSKRCADVDLHRWFTGGYAVPAVRDDPDRDEAAIDENDPEAET